MVSIMGGLNVELTDPDLTGLRIETLGRILSHLCRYNGSTGIFYSVARHSTLGAVAMRKAYGNNAAKAFLLHDAHEGIIGDITTPVENAIGSAAVGRLKSKVDRAIEREFGVDFGEWQREVADLDREMLYNEWLRLMPGAPEAVGIHPPDKCILTLSLQLAIKTPVSMESCADSFVTGWRFLNE